MAIVSYGYGRTLTDLLFDIPIGIEIELDADLEVTLDAEVTITLDIDG